MKTRIVSALAVLAGVAVLSACSGSPSKTHSSGSGASGTAVIQPAAAGQPTSGAGNAGPAGATSAAGGNAAGSSSATSEDPDADLNAANQDLSGIDSDLSQAAQSPSDGG